MTRERQKYVESKSWVLKGFGLLLLGSLLLLTRKLPVPEAAWAGAVLGAAVPAGAVLLLLGNGFILFGLLVFADQRGGDQKDE